VNITVYKSSGGPNYYVYLKDLGLYFIMWRWETPEEGCKKYDAWLSGKIGFQKAFGPVHTDEEYEISFSRMIQSEPILGRAVIFGLFGVKEDTLDGDWYADINDYSKTGRYKQMKAERREKAAKRREQRIQ
jgi:hypothetical protein